MMDANTIEEFFKEWKEESKLTSEGVLKAVNKNSVSWLYKIIVVFVGGIYTLYKQGAGFFPILVMVAIIAILIYLFYQKEYFKLYRDKFLSVRYWLSRKEYAYSDIVSIKRAKKSYERKDERVYYDVLYVKMKDGAEVSISDFFTRFDDVNYFFVKAFQSIYWKEPDPENVTFYNVAKLFATMIAMRADESYRKAAQAYAVEYISDNEIDPNSVNGVLSEYVSQIDAHEFDTNSRDICLELLKGKVTYEARLNHLTALFGCAYADDNMVDEVELDRLSKIAFYLVIKDWDFNSLKYRFIGEKEEKARTSGQRNSSQWESSYKNVCAQRRAKACAQLGVSDNATLEEVKSAYRSKVKTCHPDMLPANASEKEKEEAAIEFRTLTEAYDYLCGELAKVPA